MDFQIVSEIRDPETIAIGSGIRELARLRRAYGPGRWRKRKGTATDRTIGRPDSHRRGALVRSERDRQTRVQDQTLPGLRPCTSSTGSPSAPRNDGYPASLEVRRVYPVLVDPGAAADGFVRVVDGSGEDYLYPESYFIAIEVPRAAEALFQAAS